MRLTAAIILLAALLAGAYLLGVRRSNIEPSMELPESETETLLAWNVTNYSNEGAICFENDTEGTTWVRVTPQARYFPPSCIKTEVAIAGIVLNQADSSIHAHSNFRISSQTACATLDHGPYPNARVQLGSVEPGEYQVMHGDTIYGTIQLPVTAEIHSGLYSHCLFAPESIK